MFFQFKKSITPLNTCLLLPFICISLSVFAAEKPNYSQSVCVPERIATNKVAITEEDILENDVVDEITEEDIQLAVNNAKSSLTIPKNSSIMLVQAGKKTPDILLLSELMTQYSVSTFSGLKEKKPRYLKYEEPQANYIKNLRLIAAKGKQSHIIVYWDNFEIGTVEKFDRDIKWRSCAGGTLPTETKYLRYGLYFILVDVKTGQWSMYNPAILEEAPYKRPYKKNDITTAQQVEQLKRNMFTYASQRVFLHYSGIKTAPKIETEVHNEQAGKLKIIFTTANKTKTIVPETQVKTAPIAAKTQPKATMNKIKLKVTKENKEKPAYFSTDSLQEIDAQGKLIDPDYTIVTEDEPPAEKVKKPRRKSTPRIKADDRIL